MSQSEQGSSRRTIGRVAEQVGSKARGAVSAANPAERQSTGRGASADEQTQQPGSPTQTTTQKTTQKAGPKQSRREARKQAAAARGKEPRPAARKPRQARLRLVQVDAWSVMKTAALLSLALGIVSVVAVAIVWGVLSASGLFESINEMVRTVMGDTFDVGDYLGTGRILGFTMIVAVVNVFLMTAIATLAAFLYNLAATLVGGVELTLAEDS